MDRGVTGQEDVVFSFVLLGAHQCRSNLIIREVRRPDISGVADILAPVAKSIVASDEPSGDKPTPFDAFIAASQKEISAAVLVSRSFSHVTNIGTVNETSVKQFLRRTFVSSTVGIGSGEVMTPDKPDAERRQIDIVVYNALMPRLNLVDGCDLSLFFLESVIVAVEVKTTLTNAALSVIGKAAECLPTVPHLVVALEANVELDSIITKDLPLNLIGIIHTTIFFFNRHDY